MGFNSGFKGLNACITGWRPSTIARAQLNERLFYSAYISLLLGDIKIFPGREQQTQDTETGRTEQYPPSRRYSF